MSSDKKYKYIPEAGQNLNYHRGLLRLNAQTVGLVGEAQSKKVLYNLDDGRFQTSD